MEKREVFTPDPEKHYIKSFNKSAGTTYVYEVMDDYWDKQKQQTRSKRRLVAKIDPETGDMISTAKKAPVKKTKDPALLYQEALKTIAEQSAQITALKKELQDLQAWKSQVLLAVNGRADQDKE